jgi:zinc-binding in reverse transcriptase
VGRVAAAHHGLLPSSRQHRHSPLETTTPWLLSEDSIQVPGFRRIQVPQFHLLWKDGILLKICAFLWLVFHYRILNKYQLIKKGRSGCTDCVLFRAPLEDSEHFLLHCSTTAQVWDWVNWLVMVPFDTSSLSSLWDSCQNNSQQVSTHKIAFCVAVCWGI